MLEDFGGALDASCGLPPAPATSPQSAPSVYAVIDNDPYAYPSTSTSVSLAPDAPARPAR